MYTGRVAILEHSAFQAVYLMFECCLPVLNRREIRSKNNVTMALQIPLPLPVHPDKDHENFSFDCFPIGFTTDRLIRLAIE